jgi:hypothetical protein
LFLKIKDIAATIRNKQKNNQGLGFIESALRGNEM